MLAYMRCSLLPMQTDRNTALFADRITSLARRRSRVEQAAGGSPPSQHEATPSPTGVARGRARPVGHSVGRRALGRIDRQSPVAQLLVPVARTPLGREIEQVPNRLD